MSGLVKPIYFVYLIGQNSWLIDCMKTSNMFFLGAINSCLPNILLSRRRSRNSRIAIFDANYFLVGFEFQISQAHLNLFRGRERSNLPQRFISGNKYLMDSSGQPGSLENSRKSASSLFFAGENFDNQKVGVRKILLPFHINLISRGGGRRTNIIYRRAVAPRLFCCTNKIIASKLQVRRYFPEAKNPVGSLP